MVSSWKIIGIIGIFFASIYKIPQINKLIKTKKGDDLSHKMFLLHITAYIFLLTYQIGTNIDYILISYYSIGILQTLTLIILKFIYGNSKKKESNVTTI